MVIIFLCVNIKLGVVPDCYKICKLTFINCLSLGVNVNILDCLQKRGVCYLQKCL